MAETGIVSRIFGYIEKPISGSTGVDRSSQQPPKTPEMNTKSTFREYLHRPACGLSLAALLCLAPRPAAAQTWDANADFSLASNPNGAWTYQWLTGLSPGQYGDMTNSDANWFGTDLPAWGSGAISSIPAVMKNNSASTYAGWAPGVLGMHPGSGGNHAVVTWTAPAAGTYAFVSSFTHVGGAGNGVIPSVTRNVFSAPVAYGSQWIGTTSPTWSWCDTLTLNAGDTISWALNPNGDEGGDSTVLSAVVTALPAGAQTWDPNADFSLASNPNGAWTYQWLTGLAPGQYGDMTTAEANFGGQPGLQSWDLGAASVPAVLKNTDPTNTYYGWAPGVLGMHPGSGGNHAVVTWTAPAAGSYLFTSTFTWVGSAGDGVIPSVTRNVFSAPVAYGSQWIGTTSPTWTWSDTLTLSAGETISWALNPNGNEGGDSTVLDATITALTAPSGYSSWASGFTSPPLSDTSATADPDNDGLSNTVEYALGLDPRYSNGSPGVTSNNGKTITFTKGSPAKTDSNLTYQIETSPTLGAAPNPWTADTVNVSNLADTIAITFPNPGPAKNFARLKVTLTSP